MYSHEKIRTKDGKEIGISIYSPAQPDGKTMIIAPTGGVTQELYSTIATWFSQRGFSVITFDYRGVGRSAPEKLKGYAANMHQWAVQDIDAVILFAKNKYPLQEIIYLGHCVGGEIVGLAQASQYINKLVLVNSALSCRKLWPLRYRFRMVTLRFFVRMMSRWRGYFPGKKVGYSEDLPEGVMLEWANWCSSNNGLFDKFPDNNYRKLMIPILAFSFTDNWNTPMKAVQELLNHFSNACITWHHMKPTELGFDSIGHYGFFYSSAETPLWKMLLSWLSKDDMKKHDQDKSQAADLSAS